MAYTAGRSARCTHDDTYMPRAQWQSMITTGRVAGVASVVVMRVMGWPSHAK